MGPLLALVFIALAGIFAVGVVTGGLSNIFEILFTFFPYFIALGIGLFILARIGNFGLGRNQNDNGLLAGLIGALTGAGISELGEQRAVNGRSDDSSTPTSRSQDDENFSGTEQQPTQQRGRPESNDTVIPVDGDGTDSPERFTASPPSGDNNLNTSSHTYSMGLRDKAGQYASKASGLFENDEQIEEQELSEMGQLADQIQKEMGDLEKEEEIDQKLLQDIRTISAHLRQLMEHEGEMKKLLAQGITIENYEESLPRVRDLATKIRDEGNEVSEEFEQLKNDINAQTSESQEIEMDEQNLKELAQAVSSEHDRHKELISKAEQVLEQGLLSDHPYNNQ